eukprot:GHVQ01021835.1.p1 GENE.GHVQ01021835.1~~GHVQ01021835.1.p1  ORF type:complete len:526 (+),score=91.07 GHVQ01021835.1:581-2158(+)
MSVPSSQSSSPSVPSSYTDLVRHSLLRSQNFFCNDNHIKKPSPVDEIAQAKERIKFLDEYANLEQVDLSTTKSTPGGLPAITDTAYHIPSLPPPLPNYGNDSSSSSVPTSSSSSSLSLVAVPDPRSSSLSTRPHPLKPHSTNSSIDNLKATFDFSLAKHNSNLPSTPAMAEPAQAGIIHPNDPGGSRGTSAAAVELSHLVIKKQLTPPKPVWHPPWTLQRVISGHQGWVQCVAVDHSNEWFATGSNDRLIKIWDLASGTLKLSLTGHINTVRGLAISARHPYLFSCGEDNRVKCWDLEQNKVVRDYHGHLSGVYCLSLHPALDVLCSGGRDAVVRVWDMRTKTAIHVLSGHKGTVMSVQCQSLDPQIISGCQDKTVRLWDLAAGKSAEVLTHHKKSIRAIAVNHREYSFCSAAADNIKVWQCPDGKFERNIEGHNAILNCCALKDDGASTVLVAGSNNGQLNFWDWPSGYIFQTIQSRVQPGSLESENGIFACTFDKSETRLITGECDKTIKVWKEDEQAEPPGI